MSQPPAQEAQANIPQHKQPGLWIQYMGTRARALNAVKDPSARELIRVLVFDEFRADLQALSLGEIPMADYQVIWESGQIRGMYPPLRVEICHAIQCMVQRTLTQPEAKERMSERMIAGLFYSENGRVLDIAKLASKPPALRPKNTATVLPTKGPPPETGHPRAASNTNVAVGGPAQKPPRSSPRLVASTSQPQTDGTSQSNKDTAAMDRAREVRNPATRSEHPPTSAGGESVLPAPLQARQTLPAHTPAQSQEWTQQTGAVELVHGPHAHLASQQPPKAALGQPLLPSIQLQEDGVSGSGATSKPAFSMSAPTTLRQPITPSTVTLSGSSRAALDSVRTISSAGTPTVSSAGGLMAAPELGRWSAPSDSGGCGPGMSSDPSLASSVHVMTEHSDPTPVQRSLPPSRWSSVGHGAPLSPTAPSLPKTAQPYSPPAVSLTAGSCDRLRDRAEDTILSACPVVQILVLRGVDPGPVGHPNQAKAYEAYVTDGRGYVWIALAPTLQGRIAGFGNADHLQIGSVAKLKNINRLEPGDTCAVLVRDFELVTVRLERPTRVAEITMKLSSNALELPSVHSIHHSMSPPTLPDADGAAAAALKKERAQRLLAEMRLQEERQNRLVLESALAHVCADLHRRDAIAPAVLKVMERIEDLTDFVMGDSPI